MRADEVIVMSNCVSIAQPLGQGNAELCKPMYYSVARSSDVRLIESVCCSDPAGKALQKLADLGLLEKALPLIDVNPAGAIANHLSATTFFLLLATMTTCATGAAAQAHALLNGALHGHLRTVLATSSVALANNCTTSVVRSQSQLLQVWSATLLAHMLGSVVKTLQSACMTPQHRLALPLVHAVHPYFCEADLTYISSVMLQSV